MRYRVVTMFATNNHPVFATLEVEGGPPPLVVASVPIVRREYGPWIETEVHPLLDKDANAISL